MANADCRDANVAPNSSEKERIVAYEVTEPIAAKIAMLNPATANANSHTYALLALRETVAESICEDYGSQHRIKGTSRTDVTLFSVCGWRSLLLPVGRVSHSTTSTNNPSRHRKATSRG